MRLRSSEVVDSIYDIDFIALRACGIRTLLFDLDKTLGPRRAATLPERSFRLLESLEAQDFAIGILSNRRRPKNDPLIDALSEQFPLRHTAGKPRRGGYLALLERLTSRPEEAAMIGDKWSTDILGANRAGLYSIRVRRHPTH